MKKKIEKIPYQAYQALKIKNAKLRFKPEFYPWPVMLAILVPLTIFILGMVFYFVNLKKFGT